MNNQDWKNILKKCEEYDNWIEANVDKTKPFEEQTEEVQQKFDALLDCIQELELYPISVEKYNELQSSGLSDTVFVLEYARAMWLKKLKEEARRV